MNNEIPKHVLKDPDGLVTYEYIANNIESLNADNIQPLLDNLMRADTTGQFTASAARYLYAIDPTGFASAINTLVAATIDRDRERRYIGTLLQAIWGDDYQSRISELNVTDDNFRRIYKRLYSRGI
ncbi:MAG: hypothetical protein K2L81_07560 [Muribaculaceae bacterium]|nr:hypothetical protein [Muribaculaceae bacterium]